MPFSKIQSIKIPLIIPRRNKGHQEIVCSFDISTSSILNVEDFIQYLIPYMKTTCVKDFPMTIAKTLKNFLSLSDLAMEIKFLYHLDRASAKFENSTYELACIYKILLESTHEVFSMGISIPIRIFDVFPIPSTMDFFVYHPADFVHFEDLFDHVHQFTGIRTYPIISYSDKEFLKPVLDKGKTPKEYFNILERSCKEKKLGLAAFVKICTTDVYNIYNIEYEKTWIY
jgi:hypothetical protein